MSKRTSIVLICILAVLVFAGVAFYLSYKRAVTSENIPSDSDMPTNFGRTTTAETSDVSISVMLENSRTPEGSKLTVSVRSDWTAALVKDGVMITSDEGETVFLYSWKVKRAAGLLVDPGMDNNSGLVRVNEGQWTGYVERFSQQNKDGVITWPGAAVFVQGEYVMLCNLRWIVDSTDSAEAIEEVLSLILDSAKLSR